jgi:hypothetical protein
MKRLVTRLIIPLGAMLLVGAAIQVVPYGRDYTNPPVVAEPAWDSVSTRQLAKRACFDCHSNETRWPEYARVAPVSWLVAYDVREGREALNFSEWQRPQEEAAEAVETIVEGDMPPVAYRLMHRSARLTDAERELLMRGMAATLGAMERGSRDE